MSVNRKDLLNEPNKRGFAPIVTKGSTGKIQPIVKGMDGDDEGGDGDEDPEKAAEEEAQKSKVRKGMPPGLKQAQAAKEGSGDDEGQQREPDGDEGQGGGGDGDGDENNGGGDGKKPSPPPFMKKGGRQVSVDDLEKSLGKLQEFVTQDDAPSRKEALLSKAQAEELSKSEKDELFQLLGGQAQSSKATTAQEVIKGFTENDTLQKALDVSDYLQEQHTALVKSLGTLGDALEQSGNRQHGFNLLLAKAVGDMGGLVKALVERVGAIEVTPARGPKSKLSQQVLNKGFGGNRAAEDGAQFSKSQVLDGMEDLLQKSTKAGHEGRLESGEDILTAISKYESSNFISKSMLAEVTKQLGGGAR